MTEFLQMDIFFFVTTIVVIVLGIFHYIFNVEIPTHIKKY